jgi:hypothetical protein
MFMRRLCLLAVAAFALVLVPQASAGSQIYWWQQNMSPSQIGYDRRYAANHNYNELFFGPNAGWWGEVWEVTPAGARHYDRTCQGNCFNAHPATYYTYVYCANRDGRTHFVYDCSSSW